MMSIPRFLKPDADLVAHALLVAAFTIVVLVTLGLGRPAHALMPSDMNCPKSSVALFR